MRRPRWRLPGAGISWRGIQRSRCGSRRNYGRAPAFSDLPALPYTEAIIREALRLYPSAWAIERRATAKVVVGEQLVAKGRPVVLSPWVVQRDPRWFVDPEAFRPERWVEGLAQRLPRFAYFPFGGGPRGFIGARFALTEAVLLLATVAQQYHLTLVPGK